MALRYQPPPQQNFVVVVVDSGCSIANPIVSIHTSNENKFKMLTYFMGSRTVWLDHQHANHLSKAVKTWNNLVWSMIILHKQPITAIMLCVWAMRGMSWEQGRSNSLMGEGGGRSAGLFGSLKIWVFKCKEWRVVINNSNEDRRRKNRWNCRWEDHNNGEY